MSFNESNKWVLHYILSYTTCSVCLPGHLKNAIQIHKDSNFQNWYFDNFDIWIKSMQSISEQNLRVIQAGSFKFKENKNLVRNQSPTFSIVIVCRGTFSHTKIIFLQKSNTIR